MYKPPKPGMNLWVKGVLALTFGTAAYAFYSSNDKPHVPPPPPPIAQSYTAFVDQVNTGKIDSITVQSNTVTGKGDDGITYKTYMPSNENIVDRTKDSGVEITAVPPAPPPQQDKLWQTFITFGPTILFLALGFWLIRAMMKRQGGMNSFNKSKAKVMREDQTKVTFDDVAGIEEAKQDLQEMVEFLRDPNQFTKLGGKSPTGALLVGPPGTGKTLIAKAVAGEAKVPFFSISGSDFVEMYVGTGAARARDLFAEAKKSAPCIIFIDEIDAVGKKRGQGGPGGSNDEREQTLNQILVEMDGFDGNEGIIVLAATNRSDVLDDALMRPGRFDRKINVNLPDLVGREKILAVHTKFKPLADNVDLRVIARGTPGFSGADLANLVNEAALLAARRKRNVITPVDFEDAKDKILMGAENRTLAMSDEEKRLTAYHEAGHAIIAALSPESDPIHKATIIPRGGALGMVIRLPERDRVSASRARLKADLAVAYGGREAEEMIFGYDKVTTGASGDIQWATGVATRMVTEWGMSDKVGPRLYRPTEMEFYSGKNVSVQAQKVIDSEIDALLIEAQKRARQILTEHAADFHKIAEALIQYETLTGDEIRAMLKGEDIAALKAAARLKEAQANDNVQREEQAHANRRRPRLPGHNPG